MRYAHFDARPGTPDGVTVRFEKLELIDSHYDPADSDFENETIKARHLARFYRGQYWAVGIVARGHIAIVANGIGTTFEIDSPGLWGIETSDSKASRAYLNEVYSDECQTLRGMIETLRAGPVTYAAP